MSDQDGTQASVVQRPVDDDKEAWLVFWEQQGQEWRKEPEISIERQRYLAKLYNTPPDHWHITYPFEGVELKRSDVEWLLAMRENGRITVKSGDESLEGGSKSITLNLQGADLRRVYLSNLPLRGVDLSGALLDSALLFDADLSDAHLNTAHLEGACLIGANLAGADLFNAFFDSRTRLDDAVFANEQRGAAKFADVHWSDVNLAVVDWSTVSVSGEESKARHLEKVRSEPESWLLIGYERAARAYRQLSVVLSGQGLSEDANRFGYRAQLMQRKVYWHQGKFLQYLFSLFLDILAGYGYKAWRSFLAYLIVIAVFALAYFSIGRTVGPALSPLGSFVFSMTSFHGRGFFPGGIKLDDPLTVLAALEAFIGLLIEVTFIATLTRRLFGQ